MREAMPRLITKSLTAVRSFVLSFSRLFSYFQGAGFRFFLGFLIDFASGTTSTSSSLPGDVFAAAARGDFASIMRWAEDNGDVASVLQWAENHGQPTVAEFIRRWTEDDGEFGPKTMAKLPLRSSWR